MGHFTSILTTFTSLVPGVCVCSSPVSVLNPHVCSCRRIGFHGWCPPCTGSGSGDPAMYHALNLLVGEVLGAASRSLTTNRYRLFGTEHIYSSVLRKRPNEAKFPSSIFQLNGPGIDG